MWPLFTPLSFFFVIKCVLHSIPGILSSYPIYVSFIPVLPHSLVNIIVFLIKFPVSFFFSILSFCFVVIQAVPFFYWSFYFIPPSFFHSFRKFRPLSHFPHLQVSFTSFSAFYFLTPIHLVHVFGFRYLDTVIQSFFFFCHIKHLTLTFINIFSPSSQ